MRYTLTVSPPKGLQLEAEILAAHGVEVAVKFYGPDEVEVVGVDAVNNAILESVDLSATVAAHVSDPDWAPTPEEAAIRTELRSIGVDLDALQAKARSVYRGESTFTNAQSQKILAALALLELRRR